jgi:hypothetical protein
MDVVARPLEILAAIEAEKTDGDAPSRPVTPTPVALEAIMVYEGSKRSCCDGSYICDCRLWYVPPSSSTSTSVLSLVLTFLTQHLWRPRRLSWRLVL